MYAKMIEPARPTKGDAEPEGDCWVVGAIPLPGICFWGWIPYVL